MTNPARRQAIKNQEAQKVPSSLIVSFVGDPKFCSQIIFFHLRSNLDKFNAKHINSNSIFFFRQSNVWFHEQIFINPCKTK